MYTMQTGRRVVCGISGGVDSAVAALLLKKKGYEVIGLFMRNWDTANEKGNCLANADFEDAQLICSKLGVKLHHVNFVKEYWNNVFSEMLQDYQNGITPNPDILCNKRIKFDAFFHHAIQVLGADFIATGHYALTSSQCDSNEENPRTGVKLLKALDTVKDQTFFLSQISQKALRQTIFPVGCLQKSQVKRIAMETGLEKIAHRKESMGICFIGSREFQRFIEEYIAPEPGDFIDVETREEVGRHKGIHYWTLGQRANIPGQKQAYYTAEKCIQTNSIIVAPGTDHPALFSEMVIADTPHWISEPPPSLLQQQEAHLDFRFQSKHPLVPCTVKLNNGSGLIAFLSRPMRAVTPGQYAVFYHENECLGSARIICTGPSLYERNFNQRVKNPSEFS